MARIYKTRRGKGFLEGYQLQEPYLLPPDRILGQPGLMMGATPEGAPILVKVWPRQSNSADDDLKEIWHHELRQLYRLAGYPGSYELIAHLLRAGIDEKGFYLVLDLGQKSLLSTVVDDEGPAHWLNQPRVEANRLLIWHNLKRLCGAIDILHSQGLLHRKLDVWSVITSGGREADFQLTGFEWAVRLTSAAQALAKPSGQDKSDNYSFKHDWLLFALLAAELLGVKRDRLLDLRIAPFEVADHLAVEEVRLLRAIAEGELPERGSSAIVARIDEVVRLIGAKVAGLDAKFHLAMRLGTGSPLSSAIRRADVNADNTHKLIRDYEVTDAAVHDSRVLDELLDKGNTCKDVFADSAYRSAEIEQKLTARGFRSRICVRGRRGRPVSKAAQAAKRQSEARYSLC